MKTKAIVGVTYQPMNDGSTDVILAIRYHYDMCSLTANLPIERSKIPSDYTAALLVLAHLECNEGAYQINLPIVC